MLLLLQLKNYILYNMTKKSILGFILFVVVGGSLATSGYFYKQYEKIKKNPNLVAQEEVKNLVTQVGQLMVLPVDEVPSVATVVDKDKLKDQPFFKNTVKDDKILIYTKAKKAILYRPSTHKIIEFAPLAISDNQSQPTVLGTETSNPSPASEPVAEPVKVVLLNGSKTTGLTNDAENKIKQINGTQILYKNNAANSDYTASLVIDLTGGHDDLIKQIAQSIDGSVSSMVADEQKPANADILVIVSK